MPRFNPTGQSGRARQAACALLLATSALALVGASTADAQQLGLRGDASESSVQQNRAATIGNSGAVRTTPQPAGTNQPYIPASAGAVADTADGASSTTRTPNSQATGDPFASGPIPAPRSNASAPAGLDTTPTASTTDAAGNSADTSLADAPPQPTNQREPTIDSLDRQPLDRGAERPGSIEGRDRRPDDDPFAAVGIRAGSFILRPSLEEGITATSNANSSFNGRSAVLSETTLRLNAVSDWRENSATLDANMTYRKTLSGEEVDELRGRVQGSLTVDLADDWRAIANLGYEAAPESASSPVAIEGAVSQPLRQTLDGSLGLEKDIGKARFALTGAVEHSTYGDAKLSSGGTLSQKDRDSTLYTATLRGGYEISPALTPFVEIETGRRLYAERIDSSGYERSATRLGARAGVELDMGEKLAGEFSAGWLREAIDDSRLAPVAGATMNADLRWSPERGTTIGLSGSTIVENTTNAGESGSLLYSSRLSLERRIRDNLTGNAALGADWRDYVGSDAHDLTLSAEASLTWWLNRYAGLTTRARTEKLTSNLPGREATTNSIFVGLTLQR
jgi:hypothetical protein